MKTKRHAASRLPLVHPLLLIVLMLLIGGCSTPSQDTSLKPLHLPRIAPGAPCPLTDGHKVTPSFGFVLGDGPVYAIHNAESEKSTFAFADAQHFATGNNSTAWGGQKVLWIINPDYTGSVVIRGHQIDGPHEMRFGGGLENNSLLTTLDLSARMDGSPWPGDTTYTRLQVPGCYAYQVDGDNFSYTIVFQAVLAN